MTTGPDRGPWPAQAGPPADGNEPGDTKAPPDWDWEGVRIEGKLHLFYYFRDRVFALAPLDDLP